MQNSNYIIIQGWMVNELELKGNELLVYALIYGFSQDGDSKFTGSLNYITETLKISKKTALNILSVLVDNGLITKNEIYNNKIKFCEYAVNYTGGVEITPGWCKNYTGGGVKITPNNTINNTINNTTNNTNAFFDQLWKLYPKKEGKGQVSKAQKEKLNKIGLEEMTRAIERYGKAKEGTEKQYLQNGSTFFNSGYIDYLDANFIEDKPKSTVRML